jgi:lipopolysaccharide/colanic/teichoic acid biosynthesis glycosyltransferase
MAQPPKSLSESFIRRARESPRRDRIDTTLRALDISLALVFLAIAAIPIALITIAILTTSGRPVFYRGQRVGRGGHFYTMLKFRTLRAGAEERLGPYLGPELVEKTRDERTTVGRWLRATQLDELPQLLNVLRGDMSLVGPRPIRPIFFEQLAAELPAY